MKAIKTFTLENKIKIESEMVDENPNFRDDFKGYHYKVTLIRGKKRFTTFFSKGIALTAEPEVNEVLDCLASDVSDIDQEFEQWCSGLGLDTDSRKAEKIYKACQTTAKKLKKFLDEALYQELVFETERL